MAQLVMFFLVVLDVLNCASLQLDVDDHSVSLASPKEIGEAGVEPTSLFFFWVGMFFLRLLVAFIEMGICSISLITYMVCLCI